MSKIIRGTDEPPLLQQKEVISNIDRQSDKPAFGNISWILIRQRGLLATGMVVAIADKFSRIKHLLMV